jgi:hypothetical protein
MARKKKEKKETNEDDIIKIEVKKGLFRLYFN